MRKKKNVLRNVTAEEKQHLETLIRNALRYVQPIAQPTNINDKSFPPKSYTLSYAVNNPSYAEAFGIFLAARAIFKDIGRIWFDDTIAAILADYSGTVLRMTIPYPPELRLHGTEPEPTSFYHRSKSETDREKLEEFIADHT